ncbi:MAG: hypothetical protein Q8M92_09630, partial [Candidatus Subteraquimicrobiales bacterium]|nr:hypothetical protein [Candidatus Subteraquimicrobiales bacterium]
SLGCFLIAFINLWYKYAELTLQIKRISSLTNSLAELMGYKRVSLNWTIIVHEDESLTSEKRFNIQSYRELSEIVLWRDEYPGLENNTPQVNNDYMYPCLPKTPNGEKIKVISEVYYHKRKIVYGIKFNPALPKNSMVEIITKPIIYPKGSLEPDAYYENIKKEKGKAITYITIVPTGKIIMEIKLPENKEYLALAPHNRYCAVSPMDTDDFIEEKTREINCERVTPNIFKVTIDNPSLFYEYSFFWKDVDK